MKKLLYIFALFILKSQAQTHSFPPAGSTREEESKKAPLATYFSKAEGDLTNVNTWGTNPDGSGTHPSNFSEDAYFRLQNRIGEVALQGDWTVSNLEIDNGINLFLGANTLVIHGGVIRYNGSGKIKGSPESSIIVDNRKESLTLVLDSSVPGKSNALKSLMIHTEKKTAAAPVTFGSDVHIYETLILHAGDLVIGNHNICLKSAADKQATFQTPGIHEDRANVLYNGSGRFIIEQLGADGKILGIIAHPFTEKTPVSNLPEESNKMLGSAEEAAEQPMKGYIGKNLIQDDIKLFINIKFLDFFTRVNLDPLYC